MLQFLYRLLFDRLFPMSLGLLIVGLSQPAQAQRIQQVPIINGRGSFINTRFMSPNTGVIFNQSTNQPTGQTDRTGVFYQNNDVRALMLRTQLGDVPMNARFDTTLLPTVNNALNRPPEIGDQTVIQGRLTFKIPRSDTFGGISLQRVPASLNATITNVNVLSNPTPISELIARDYVFREVGVVDVSNTRIEVTRTTPVDVVQYSESGRPRDVTVAGTTVPRREFQEVRDGSSYRVNTDFAITGGTVGTRDTRVFENGPSQPPIVPPIHPIPPVPPTWNPRPPIPPHAFPQPAPQPGPTRPEQPQPNKPDGGWILINPKVQPGVLLAPPEQPPTPQLKPREDLWRVGPKTIYITDEKAEHPSLGDDVRIGVDTGYDDRGRKNNCGCEGELVFVNPKTNVVHVPIGLPSRVFPGMMGMEQQNRSN